MKSLYNHKKDVIPIHILDSVWCMTNKQGATILQHELSYNDVVWIPTGKKKKRVIKIVKMIQSEGNGKFVFHTGFVPRVLKYLTDNNITYDHTSDVYPVEYNDAFIKGITFWKHQSMLIDACVKQGRGVVHSATATGKSFVLLGLMSAFSQERILFMAHTKDLILQMEEHLHEKKFSDFGVWMGKRKENKRIILATIQSFKTVVTDFTGDFDVLLIDEVHHVIDINSKNYGYVLQRLAAPVKLGVTATLPDTEKGRMNLEALVGPVIATYNIADATKDKIIAKPIVYFLPSPEVPPSQLFDPNTVPKRRKEKLTKYKVIYYNAIVNNLNRNIDIIVLADKLMKKGKSVLIKIVRTLHGENLMQLARENNIELVFVHGGTDDEERIRIKHAFNAKELLGVIATDVYKEGVDVKSLNACIMGGGLKSEIATYQNIGRGLRRTKTKKVVAIYDFKDLQHKYVRNHYNQRYAVCKHNGWLAEEQEVLFDYYADKS